MILDCYISQNRLSEFIFEIWEIHNENQIWEIWLHKVEGKTYQEFRESLTPPKPIDKTEVAETVRNSMTIIENFSPTRG